jgi:hypothetical protein
VARKKINLENEDSVVMNRYVLIAMRGWLLLFCLLAIASVVLLDPPAPSATVTALVIGSLPWAIALVVNGRLRF